MRAATRSQARRGLLAAGLAIISMVASSVAVRAEPTAGSIVAVIDVGATRGHTPAGVSMSVGWSRWRLSGAGTEGTTSQDTTDVSVIVGNQRWDLSLPEDGIRYEPLADRYVITARSADCDVDLTTGASSPYADGVAANVTGMTFETWDTGRGREWRYGGAPGERWAVVAVSSRVEHRRYSGTVCGYPLDDPSGFTQQYRATGAGAA